MALDTTIGGASADSYATLAEYAARATAMGWTLGTDAANEQNLRRAALAIDATYAFVGFRQYRDGGREWPRVVPSDYLVNGWSITPDTIPAAVKAAQMELAYLIQGGADPLATYEGGVKREKIDVIEVEYTAKGRARYDAVDRLLRDYIIAGPGNTRMVRG